VKHITNHFRQLEDARKWSSPQCLSSNVMLEKIRKKNQKSFIAAIEKFPETSFKKMT